MKTKKRKYGDLVYECIKTSDSIDNEINHIKNYAQDEESKTKLIKIIQICDILNNISDDVIEIGHIAMDLCEEE